MNWLLIAQLLVAHVAGDFLLQPDSWVKSRNQKHFRSGSLYLHALVHFLLALIFVWKLNAWWVALLIAIGHLIFDGLKSWLKLTDLKSFLADQFLHFLIILVFAGKAVSLPWKKQLAEIIHSEKFWWILLSYLLITTVYPRFIAFATLKWRREIAPGREILLKAGRWIGIMERVLILTFILAGQFSAIGFLLAAKSVFRFGDLSRGKDKGHTEYVLIGTFLSFGLTILTGLLLNQIIAEP